MRHHFTIVSHLFFTLIDKRSHHVVHKFLRVTFVLRLVVVRNWPVDGRDIHELAKGSPALLDVVDQKTLVGVGFDIRVVGFVACSEMRF